MAILVYGMRCRLCGKAIEEGQEVVAFSPFVSNELDPLLLFNDAACHAECFARHPLAERALARYGELKERVAFPYRCIVCGQEITDQDDFFTFGHLTDDEAHPLHRYNYAQFHRSHLAAWPELPPVYEQLQALQHSGAWGGEALRRLLSEIEEIRSRQEVWPAAR